MANDFFTFEQIFAEYWPHIIFGLSVAAGTTAAVHAAMTKTEVRAAIGWVGVILMSPLLGPFLYLIAGINRIRHDQIAEQRNTSLLDYTNSTEALKEPERADPSNSGQSDSRNNRRTSTDTALKAVITPQAAQLESLHTLGDRISHFPLLPGNSIQLLNGGDETYPAMIQAIEQAKYTIAMQSYIFDNDRAGQAVADALNAAQQRGVQVRVLIDAVGSKYSRPPITRLLKKYGITSALFMTNPLGVMRMPYANLRSHRKILIIDGHTGFTGGMNIREGFLSAVAGDQTTRDIHFRIQGPVVPQLMSVFAHDWEFTTHEHLPFSTWCPSNEWNSTADSVPVRCVRSGPDRFLGSTHSMLLGALAVARSHVRIQSPYFLPDQVLMGAITTAARRGVTVDIVIPGQNNLKLVDCAMMAQIDQVIEAGCRVWRTTGTFNHAKLFTLDGQWSYVGSSNLDPRSLRLNFELDMEVYSPELARQLEQAIDAEIATARQLTLQELTMIPFRKRLRNRIIWLASPYL